MNTIKKIRLFIGEEVYRLYIQAFFVGFCWFAVESSFVFILQGFLVSLGIMDAKMGMLPEWYPQSLLTSSLILVVYGVFRSLIILYRNYLSGSTGQVFNRHMRERFLNYGLNNVQTIPMHEIVSLFNERTQQTSAVLQYFVFFIINSVSLTFFLIMGLKIAPLELIIGLALLALFLVPFQYLNKRIENTGKELVKEWNSVSSTLLTGFKNYFFLKFYNLIPQEVQKGKKSLQTYQDHYLGYHWLSSIKLAFPVFIGSVVVSFISFVSFKYWKTSGAVLLAFYYIFIRIAQSASDSSTVLSIIKLNLHGFKILKEWNEKIIAFEEVTKKIQYKGTNDQILSEFRNQGVKIKVENLSFSYLHETPILKNLNLEAQTNCALLIKGESGAGKSTLISLLAGFNDPSHGKITINDHALKDVQQELLDVTAYVGPEPYLIGGTVRDNLLYGNPKKLSDSDIWKALELSQIAKEVDNLKLKLDENLNELTQLSTGQKQRLSFARALLRQPKLLVLDEATANLDPVTEKSIIENLKVLKQKMTLIIISHKDTFDSLADNTLMLKKI